MNPIELDNGSNAGSDGEMALSTRIQLDCTINTLMVAAFATATFMTTMKMSNEQVLTVRELSCYYGYCCCCYYYCCCC